MNRMNLFINYILLMNGRASFPQGSQEGGGAGAGVGAGMLRGGSNGAPMGEGEWKNKFMRVVAILLLFI